MDFAEGCCKQGIMQSVETGSPIVMAVNIDRSGTEVVLLAAESTLTNSRTGLEHWVFG